MTKASWRLVLGLGVIWLMMSGARLSAAADARTAYLINMLENGRNYRLKVQAATTLGKLRSKEAIPALVRALDDKNELVVISAASALGQIGEVKVIAAIERAAKRHKSPATKSQLESTLRVLRALSVDSEGAKPTSGKPRFLIRVDPMGNSSGVKDEQLTKKLRDEVNRRVGREPGVVMQAEGLSAAEVKKKLKKESLGGFILSGAILKLSRVDNRITMKIGLNVFTNPEYNLLMMPTAQAAITLPSGDLSKASELKAKERAMKSVVSSLVSTVFDELNQLERP